MGFALPSGVVNTDSVYFYAQDSAPPLGPHVKQPSDQTLVVVDYSLLSHPITLTSYKFSIDVLSNPNLVVAYPQTNVTANVLTFMLSGGIAGQQYNLSILVTYGPSGNRTDVLVINIPSSVEDFTPINPVPAIYNQVPLIGGGYVNTAVRYFWGQIAPANPNVADQWFNTSSNILYEWVTDGTKTFWDIISSPNYILDAPLDGALYVRYAGSWTPSPIQSDVPSPLALYVRQQGVWVLLPASVSEPPHDGQLYGRLGDDWALAYSASNPAGYQTSNQIASELAAYMPVVGGVFSGNVSFPVSATFAGPANLSIGGGTSGGILTTNGAGVLSWITPPGYVLPIATTTVLGGVKSDGVSVNISPTGVLSATSPVVIISATPPVSPSVGSLWFDSIGAQLYLYYSDGTSSQWVPAVNQAGAGGGGGLPPSNTVAPSVTPSGTVSVGQSLTCSSGSWTQTPTGFAYQWLRGGVTISGAITSGYTVQSADASATLSCSVTATNANGSTSATSNGVPVAALAPTISVAPVVTGTGAPGQTLTTTNGTWNNVPTGFAYQWQRDGVAISGATSSTYLLTGTDGSHLVGCLVTASNSGGSASSSSNSISVGAVIPANTAAPVVTGTGALGQTLTTTNGTWTNSPTSFSYQWLRTGVAISGATSATYVIVSADVSHPVSCTVTAFNSFGNGSATSNAISVIAAPTNSVAPVVSGTAQVGSTLTTTNGTWTGSPTFTYQWNRDGVAIAGALSTTYVLVTADATHSVNCTVTATNVGGNATAGSNALTITVAPPINSVAPVASGLNSVGSVLTTTNGTWSGSPTFSYQWLRDAVNISGATSSSYTVVTADQSHSVSCAVTGTNPGGSATAASNAIAISAAGATSIWSASDASINSMTLTNGSLTVTSSQQNTSIRGTNSQTTGKLYVEFLAGTTDANMMFGLASGAFNVAGKLGVSNYSGGVSPAGNSVSTGFTSNYTISTIPHVTDVWALAVDFTAGSVWLAINNVWVNGSDPVAGTLPILSFTPATVGALFPALTMELV